MSGSRQPGREQTPLDKPNPPGCICEYNHPSCSYCPASKGREQSPENEPRSAPADWIASVDG